MKIKAIKRWIHLQHTRIAVAFAHGNFLLFLIKKIPAGQCDSYTRVLQMNPPKIRSFTCMFSTEVPGASQSAMRNSKFASLECAIMFFLSATDPKARATVSIPLLKMFCVNVSTLKWIFKLFMLITIFKMAALDNNDQNSSWFCSFCSWNHWDKRGKEFY